MTKKAFITGVTGQDGAWLAKYLLELGYKVYGGVRRTSRRYLTSLEYLGVADQVELIEFDLLEQSNVFDTIKRLQVDEFYNLAAQSFVGTSFLQPISTGQIDGIGVIYILDAIKTVSPQTRFYQASTSEMFGKVQEVPQTENTPFYPRSPYGCAKLYAHWMTINYRESYNIFGACGILFNHESELRGPEFLTRKVTINAAKRATGKPELLEIGNLDSKRDWGYAKEYVEGMHALLQAEKADSFVLATGRTVTIRDFINMAFEVINIQIEWQNSGENEQGLDKKTGQVIVKVNPKFYRPAEVDLLIGDPKKAKEVLGWEPKVSVEELAKIMVEHDLSLVK